MYRTKTLNLKSIISLSVQAHGQTPTEFELKFHRPTNIHIHFVIKYDYEMSFAEMYVVYIYI